MTEYGLPDWQRAFGEPVLSCEIRQVNADYRVSEQLGFDLSGDGEHDYLHIQKDGANTQWVARNLARYAGIAASDVGFAGMKDRHAITTQWFSVRRPAGSRADWQKLEVEGVRVLQEKRHRRKLRRGVHRGNHFRIALRKVREKDSGLEQRLTDIRNAGVPNYFGEQRFGHDGGNLRMAGELFAARRLSRSNRSLALSAARSFLFNQILDDRVRHACWNTLQAGDCASLDGSGSIFPVAAIDDDLRRRCADLDIHPSGALWGAGAPQSTADVAQREASIVSRFPQLSAGLQNERLEQARRALRLAVREFGWEHDGDTLWLHFHLVRGGYATAVLREITSYDFSKGTSRQSSKSFDP